MVDKLPATVGRQMRRDDGKRDVWIRDAPRREHTCPKCWTFRVITGRRMPRATRGCSTWKLALASSITRDGHLSALVRAAGHSDSIQSVLIPWC